MEFTPQLIAIIAVVGIIFHAALFFMARRFNAIAVLAMLFMIAAPLSVAELPIASPLKWGRVYLTLLACAIGVIGYRNFSFKTATLAWLAYVGYFFLGSLWSDSPISALSFKGLLLLSMLAGVFMCYSLKDAFEFRQVMRILLLGGFIFAVVILLALLLNPSSITHVGRFAPFGINPNRIAQTLAPQLIVCAFVVLYDDSKLWKVMGYIVATIFGLAILLTSARGAIVFAAAGVFGVAFPIMKRPDIVAGVGGVAGAVIYFVSKLFNTDTERLAEVNLDTREGVWTEAMIWFSESPIIGRGWAYFQPEGVDRLSMLNMHSIYFQTLAELGVIGFGILVVVLCTLFAKGLRLFWSSRGDDPYFYRMACFALGLTGATFVHGLVESGTFTGGTNAALLLGFGVALIDRIPQFMDDHNAAWASFEGETDAH